MKATKADSPGEIPISSLLAVAMLSPTYFFALFISPADIDTKP